MLQINWKCCLDKSKIPVLKTGGRPKKCERLNVHYYQITEVADGLNYLGVTAESTILWKNKTKK
jgi:hypothetical protein